MSLSALQVVAERAYANATPFRALVGVGITLSGFALLANVGGGLFGIAPLVASEQTRSSVGLTLDVAVRQWAWFFKSAAPPIVASVAGSATAYFAASRYVDPKQPHADALRTWLRVAAVVALLPLPYTITLLGPINSQLLALAGKAGQLTAQEASNAHELMVRWGQVHLVRVGIFALSTLSGVTALFSSL